MKRLAILLLALSSAALSLSACSSSKPEGIIVVASTNAWGSIAESVGGDNITVVSLISNASQDPHEFEANATTALDVSNASLVIENGGGYDDFIDKLITAHNPDVTVINAVDVSGAHAENGAELNEHVWYSPDYAAAVADEIATQLSKIDPDHAEEYRANARAFADRTADLNGQLAELKTQHEGTGVFVTEPVPLYLAESAGLNNLTPEAFSEAVEEGSEISPATLNQALSLINDGTVKVLIYNEQTSDTATEQILSAAEDKGIPVVSVTETMPSDMTYISWMQSNIDRLRDALGS